MDHELALTKTNRLKLAWAFRDVPRVDFSIACVLEGQLGRAFVDDLAQPAAYRITVGPFWYFAGDAGSAGGIRMVQGLPPYALLMPSAAGWVEAARAQFGPSLKSFPRYSFSAAGLSAAHLEGLWNASPARNSVVPLDAELAASVAGQPESFLDLSDFDSAADFVERGLGFAALDQGRVMGVAYSSLVCSQGLEVSLFVEPAYRRQGVATALSSRLILACLRRGGRPNWDAANLESCQLAEKLGFVRTGTYAAHYRAGG